MLIYETITAEGSGIWGQKYDLRLTTRQIIHKNLYKPGTQESHEYVFEFQSDNAKIDWRIFESEAERAAFIKEAVSDLKLKPVANPKSVTKEYFLGELVGEYLSAITFVMDYIQIDFSDRGFNYYRWPVLNFDGLAVTQQAEEYRNLFCGLITKNVRAIDEYLDAGLVIEFENNAHIILSLAFDENDSLAELAEYHSKDVWMIWSPE